jgi:hypothetical protein
LLAAYAELLEKRTFLEVGPPLWVERVCGLSDFDATPDFGFAGIHEAAPYQLSPNCCRTSDIDGFHSGVALTCDYEPR